MTPADLTRLFRINHGALHQNLAGVSHEESLLQPHSGNCMNWVLAHIVSSRNGVLGAMGRDPYWPSEQAARYARGSAPVTGPEDARPWDTLVQDFDQTQERILAGLSAMTEADLQKPHAREMTVGEWISFLHFHEAYHIGMAGKEGAIG
jgi:hypothetical protein